LCMIVRNEEAMLPGCLDSVRGIVDRIVVVDTGSTDRTRKIAQAAGAEVLDFAWCDDFAAARNAGLERVESGYVLVLDADERLAPGARKALEHALRKPEFDLGFLILHDAARLDAPAGEVVSGRARLGEPILVPRLLRRTPDLAFRGIVHENVSTWAEGKVARAFEIGIVHLGAVPSLRSERGKAERNLGLLEKRCAAEPDAAVPRSYLARELARAGDDIRARAEAARAWRSLRPGPNGRPLEDVIQVATLHAFLELTVDHLDEAAECLAQAREWADPHPNLDLLGGVLFERMACLHPDDPGVDEALLTARDAFVRCLAVRGRAFSSEVLPGATSWAAATRMGAVELARGEYANALAAFEAAIEESPDPKEAHLGRLEALIGCGRPGDALGELEPLLATDTPDAWTLAALAADALGSTDDRTLFLARARAAAMHTGWTSPGRCVRFLALEGRCKASTLAG
ncbi:MAG TPA: glycosyltransferase family 2 protein, partial [Planctomycetota bacterium]|nr:glycosyltransferase family 2 protein [Planctomycetota bacterium]